MNIDINNIPKLVIDPSILLDNQLEDLINDFKIKVICYSDNEEILSNLYFTMKVYFNEQVIEDILGSVLSKEDRRELKINELLKK